MRDAPRGLSPGTSLLLGTLVCLVACAAPLFARLQQRELGLTLRPEPDAKLVRVIASEDPRVAAGARLVAVGDLAIEPSDLIEEPDFFNTWPDAERFFIRQTVLHQTLAGERVAVTVVSEAGELTWELTPRRASLTGLPAVFWFQVLVSAAAMLLSLWVWSLRPREFAVRVLVALGVSIAMSALPAAVYGTRELAVDAGTFRVLSAINHLGSFLYGSALISFFLGYPVRLVSTRVMVAVTLASVGWAVLDIARLVPNQDWAYRLPTLVQMSAALVLGVVQWRATKGDPRGRIGVRWLGAFLLLGSGMFVFTVVGSSTLGWFPPMAQGYSFGYFLLMHVGFALGLRRHRLFELDEWAWRLLFWVLSGLAFLLADALLIMWLDANRAVSTGLLLLGGAFLYLPLRGWLWSKVVSRKSPPEHELFEAVLGVTFAIGQAQREVRWRALLRRLFDPMELVALPDSPSTSVISEDGVRLDVPACGDISAQRLELPWRGRGLFAPRHAQLTEQLVKLLHDAGTQREAFARGVRDERTRIARDMHDDLGAGLLSTLHQQDLDTTRDAIRQAIGDVRSIVNELSDRPVTVGELLAELRQETLRRLEAAGIAAEWPVTPGLGGTPAAHGVYRHCTAMVREVTSNVIRHSGAKHVRCVVTLDGQRLSLVMTDDGRGLEPGRAEGNGLKNLQRRAEALGGTFTLTRNREETAAHIEVSVRGTTESPPSSP